MPILSQRLIHLCGTDYRQGDWGKLVDPDFSFLVKRQHMYNSGPSLEEGSLELLELIRRYLPEGRSRIADIGCGLGFYGRHLIAEGHDWIGFEIKPSDCAFLRANGLPHQQVDGRTLPLADASQDAVLCIEVLEHVEDPGYFIKEARRICSNRMLISVPNCEVVCFWRKHLCIPWHLLESDHKSFFSRHSLRALLLTHFEQVEVISYGHLGLKTPEGCSMGYNLLAIASIGGQQGKSR